MTSASTNKKEPFYEKQFCRKIIFHRNLFRMFYSISPLFLFQYRYFLLKGTLPNLKNPQTFDEKLIWLNFFWRHPLKTICADKYTLHPYLSKLGFEQILIPLYGVYNDPEEIDIRLLPKKFVLKCTHGCGFNIFCVDKDKFNFKAEKDKLKKWLRIDFSKIYGEFHYSAIRPRIICEQFLEDEGCQLPIDYKVYCFNGQVHCTMVCVQRTINSRARYYIFYDSEWKKLLPYNEQSQKGLLEIPKPKGFEAMKDYAQQLAKPFPFVRLDFYIIRGTPLLGEMTFTPDGCIDPNLTLTAQLNMGKLIRLPEKYL